MQIILKYFSGTGNSWKMLDTCKEVFISNNHSASVSPIQLNEQLPPDADLIGFCFPVYAFGIPRICRKYLNSLQKFSRTQNVFIIITAGKKEESGFSLRECESILKKKNTSIIYSAVVEMPINWITYMNPPAEDEAQAIIAGGIIQAEELANDILQGKQRYHRFNIPPDYSRWRFYKEYYMFKYIGIQNMWRTFKIYDDCNACRLCEKLCPTASIHMEDNKPIWSSTCEQCMRCVNFCPQKAIYQSMGGGTKGRNRYHVPDFRPLKPIT